jgi:hypothetical protein
MDRLDPPRPSDFGLSSEWDGAGGGSPAYHRDEASESFRGAALSLVFLVPGLILTSFPAIRLWGLVTLVVLGLFAGFMCVNLLIIGFSELKRAERMKDPAVSAAARRYKEALSQWRRESRPQPVAQPTMSVEQAQQIMRKYTQLLSSFEKLPHPVCRPVSELPCPKREIQQAYEVYLPSVSLEMELEYRITYAQLAYFIPDEDFAWVDEAYREREARIRRHEPAADLDPELSAFATQKDAEWQSLLKEIHEYSDRVRRGTQRESTSQ